MASTLDLTSLSQRVYDLLKARILRRELAPGQPLVIGELAADLGVSTTPVRDALKRLQIEDLVVINPRRGCSVAVLSPQDLQELIEIRAIVEVAVAERTVATLPDERIERLAYLLRRQAALADGQRYSDYVAAVEQDLQFHLTIVEALGNCRLVDLFRKLRVHPRLAPDLYSAEHQRAQLDLEEHRRILEAYRQRDPAAARQAIAEHLERVKLDALAGLADLARVG